MTAPPAKMRLARTARREDRVPAWLVDPTTVGFWAFWSLIGVEIVITVIWALVALVMFVFAAITGQLRD